MRTAEQERRDIERASGRRWSVRWVRGVVRRAAAELRNGAAVDGLGADGLISYHADLDWHLGHVGLSETLGLDAYCDARRHRRTSDRLYSAWRLAVAQSARLAVLSERIAAGLGGPVDRIECRRLRARLGLRAGQGWGAL